MLKGVGDMKVEAASLRAPELIDALTALWERSVRATHSFLKAGDVECIRDLFPV